MKNALIFIALVIISILYMFEVDYTHLGTLNWIAFVIIFATVLYLTYHIAVGKGKRAAHREQKKKDAEFME